ncbi:MAG: DUF3363 domain-containing protein [Polyangiaceae bacterium]
MASAVDNEDDFPVFQPRFGRREKAARETGDASFRQATLASGALARRVIVKASIVAPGERDAKGAALHLRHIERDGVERDGSKGVLYGPDGPARREDFTEPWPGEKHQFRWVVSPEDAGELDLTTFVRRLMAQVEKDTGRRLEWAAVNHYNTEHPHAHVIIRGVDRDRHEVRFDRAYISHGVRRRAQELATRELGPRTELAIRRAHVKEITQERFTSLDRALERRAVDQVVALPPRPRAERWGIDEATLIARLEHLERLRLAERLSPMSWQLADGWASELRELGTRGDIIKRMHVALRGDPARDRIAGPNQPLPAMPNEFAERLYGRVAQKGLSDELRGSFYAIIETSGGADYHVTLDRASAERIREGDLCPWRAKRRADPRIASTVLSSNGKRSRSTSKWSIGARFCSTGSPAMGWRRTDSAWTFGAPSTAGRPCCEGSASTQVTRTEQPGWESSSVGGWANAWPRVRARRLSPRWARSSVDASSCRSGALTAGSTPSSPMAHGSSCWRRAPT